jgi:alkanesulfonate monooxygenase SsuD/methylene tetrahydromethanopterin reductase-like flavin-dependent oxidoreductase (luciferase family)
MLVKVATEAEKHGWDGFFLWDHIVDWKRRILSDAFTVLAAIAAGTERIRIGTTVTPLPRLKPWLAARQTTTLDQLSGGRMILGVGLGTEETTDYARFGERAENKILGEMLDESLEIITGLWSGGRYKHQGKYYQVGETAFLPRPVQRPRIPIWAAGFWPRKRPFLRAARWDGVIPLKLPVRLLEPEDAGEIMSFIRKHRTGKSPFDLVNIGWTIGRNRRRDLEKVTAYSDSGATWWLESLWTKRDSPLGMLERVRAGPPGK